MNNSSFGSLNRKDLINGVVIAFLAAFVGSLVELLKGGSFPSWEQLKGVGLVSLTAALSYIVKNLFSNSQGETFTKEPAA